MSFNNKVSEFLGNLFNKIYQIISINKYPFKGLSFTILLLIGIITSIIIRFDYIFNLLNGLPYELMVSLRLTSGLYNLLLIFLFIISIKQSINFYYYYIGLENKNKFIFSLYYIFILYLFLIVLLISYVNYNSIVSLNIIYLDYVFISSLIISLLFGIYFSIYKFNNNEFDLNRTLSLTGKICFITFIVFYLSLFIGIRTGVLLE
jgi:hypothetical protein